MQLDFSAFLDSLKYMGFGLLGIFVITAIIILAVQVLIKLFPPK